MSFKFRKWLAGALFVGAILSVGAFRFRDSDHAEKIPNIGGDWPWEVSSRDLSDVRMVRTEVRGTGMREGLRKFWYAMLSDDSRTRDYQLHWNEELFSLWSWDQNDLPELAVLRKARKENPQKFEQAIETLVEGQLQALLKFDEEDFDLEADTVSLLPVLHLDDLFAGSPPIKTTP